jgi:hypothetical protein
MKATRLVFAAVLLTAVVAVSPDATSQDRGFGLGVILGNPTGVSGKYWVSGQSAIDGAVAWSFRRRGFFHVHADYLWHFSDAIKSQERFIPYVGIGGRFGATKGDASLGLRLAGGIAFLPRGAPIDVFLEIAPIVDLAPATEVDVNGGVGIRFFFK